MILDNIIAIVGLSGTVTGVITSVYLFRRARKAEVQSKEIATADQMIELVKKANAEVVALKTDIAENNREIAEAQKQDNERLRQCVEKLEKAVRAIGTCLYRSQCPVTERLQDDKKQSKQGKHE